MFYAVLGVASECTQCLALECGCGEGCLGLNRLWRELSNGRRVPGTVGSESHVDEVPVEAETLR